MSYRPYLVEAHEPWLRDLAERDPERVRWARLRYAGRQAAFARMAVFPTPSDRQRWIDGLVDVWKRVDELGGRLRLTAQVALSHEVRELRAALAPRPALFASEFQSWVDHLDAKGREQAINLIERLRVGLAPAPPRRPREGSTLRLYDVKVSGRRTRWVVAELRDDAQLFLCVGPGGSDALRIARRLAERYGLELDPEPVPGPSVATLPVDFREMVAEANARRLVEALWFDAAHPPMTHEARTRRRDSYRRCRMMASDAEIREWIEGVLALQQHLDQLGVTLDTAFEFPDWNRPRTTLWVKGRMRLLPVIPSPQFRHWLEGLEQGERGDAEVFMRQLQAGVLAARSHPRGMDRYEVDIGSRRCRWIADRHGDVCYLTGVDIDPGRAEQDVLRLVREVDGTSTRALQYRAAW